MSEYPLSVLLKIRENDKDAAVAAYAQASSARAQAREALEGLSVKKTALERRRHEAREQRSNQTDIIQIRAYSEYVVGLEHEKAEVDVAIAEASKHLEAMEAALQEARATMAKAETELNAVVSHQENWQQERRAELAKKAAEALDDLAIQRWSRT